MRQVTLDVDVREAAGSNEQAYTRVTVTLPEPDAMPSPPIACFAFPGGGYSRGYYHLDVPDQHAAETAGGQAAWHAHRGWVFVACDHLYVGESSQPTDIANVSFELMAAVNAATVQHVTALLASGDLDPGFPPVDGLVRIGLGQSMGGCLLIVQQGQLGTFDGIGVLGYGATHTVLAMPPGTPPIEMHFPPRGTTFTIEAAQARAQEVTGGTLTEAEAPTAADLPFTTWGFHMDDEPQDLVIADMVDFPHRRRSTPFPSWASATLPPCTAAMLSPGVVAAEAAMIKVPVLVAVGERDTVPDPKGDPKAYQRSSDVTVVVWPDMAHMHNFATTRTGFWNRIHAWGLAVASQRS
jgi:alpha-beta hydrolase superfamily lysophospholipase